MSRPNRPAPATPRGSAEPAHDLDADDSIADDERLQRERLRSFLRAMLPIAVAYTACYALGAAALRSAALAGGAVAVGIYVVALVRARGLLGRGRVTDAALCTARALLAMVAVGTVFLHFLYAALALIPLAGVALVMPYVGRSQLRTYLAAALAVVCEVVVLGALLGPRVAQPPAWVCKPVVATAVIAAAALTIHLLWIDQERLAGLLRGTRRALAGSRAANASKDAFLAAAAHDLRTPIATLQLQAQGLTRGPVAAEVGSARVRERLARVEKQATRLAQLVDGLLDVSRIASGRFELAREPLDVADLVRASAARLEEDAARVGSELRVEAPERLEVVGDRARLEQVVTNLVSNAVKYGAGRPIELSVRRDARHLELAVRDRGIGIAEADQARIFERFERAAAAADFPGIGVGLWIVRELVGRMNGTVAVESRVGEGATFTVRIPAAA